MRLQVRIHIIAVMAGVLQNSRCGLLQGRLGHQHPAVTQIDHNPGGAPVGRDAAEQACAAASPLVRSHNFPSRYLCRASP